MKLKRNRHALQVISNTWLIDIIGLATLLFLFYTVWLGHYPLFTPDEGRYSEVAREMIASNDYITPRVNGVAFLDKPILYYWLQAIAIKLFGIQEWGLRFFPAMSGIFGCLMIYVCGRYLYDRRTGILSAIILATSFLYFIHAHYANLDLEVAVFLSSSLLLFITAIHIKNSKLILTAYLFAAFAFLTKGLIGICFPMMIIGSWLCLRFCFDPAMRNKTAIFSLLHEMRIVTGMLLFSLIVLPWYFLVQKANPEFLHFFFVTQQVTRFLAKAEFNNQSPIWFYVPIVLAGFFPWTIFLFQSIKQNIKQIKQPTELFLFLWVTLIFIFFSIPRSKIMGYILPLFPPLALMTGHYLSSIWNTIKVKNLRFHIISFQMFALLFAGILFTALTKQWIDLPLSGVLYLKGVAATLIISAIVVSAFYQRKSIVPLFASCLTLSVIILCMLLLSSTHLNQNTTKPLITYLKTIIKPEDEVINYFKYYHDIPIYLERRITIVNDWQSPNIVNKDNWARELWFGMPFQNTKDWLISEDTFWQRWQSNKRIYVFVNHNYFDQFKSHTEDFVVLAKYNDVLLLTNRPIV